MHLTGTLAPFGLREEASPEPSTTPLVCRRLGSPHLGLSVVDHPPAGRLGPHAHAFETAYFVLAGNGSVDVGRGREPLAPGRFGLVPPGVAFSVEAGANGLRWLRVDSPPAREDATWDVLPADRPGPWPILDGERCEAPAPGSFSFEAMHAEDRAMAAAAGVRARMLVDEGMGAVGLRLLAVAYEPGVELALHDHAFEEAYLIIEGEVEAQLEDETVTLRAGDYCWTGVGALHAFANRSDATVCWIETQTPRPPGRYDFRFPAQWAAAATAGQGLHG